MPCLSFLVGQLRWQIVDLLWREESVPTRLGGHAEEAEIAVPAFIEAGSAPHGGPAPRRLSALDPLGSLQVALLEAVRLQLVFLPMRVELGYGLIIHLLEFALVLHIELLLHPAPFLVRLEVGSLRLTATAVETIHRFLNLWGHRNKLLFRHLLPLERVPLRALDDLGLLDVDWWLHIGCLLKISLGLHCLLHIPPWFR
jgi:hypothetical protein